MENQVELYQSQDGINLTIQFANKTVWLSQEQLAVLFERDQSVISKHIKNVFLEGELDKESNMQKMHIANSDKPVALYNLEVVISLFFFFIAQRPTAAGRTQRPVRRGGQADKRTGGHVSFFRMII